MSERAKLGPLCFSPWAHTGLLLLCINKQHHHLQFAIYSRGTAKFFHTLRKELGHLLRVRERARTRGRERESI